MLASNRTILVGVIGTVAWATYLPAQGVTTASIEGVVADTDSSGIEGAIITVTNTANGERWQSLSRARGRYVFEYLSLGGPYTVAARAIGYRPDARMYVMLSLGERRRVDLSLSPTATPLAAVNVVAKADPLFNSGRTGPAQTIVAAQASGLPVAAQVSGLLVRGGGFSQLAYLSPQAVVTDEAGLSVAGQSDRLNSLQVDGANNSDIGSIFGLGGSGTAGAVNGVRALSIEAVRELQILIAPFDVRYGGFAGGLVNAVTRSGSNRWEGSVSGYFQTEALTGRDSSGVRAAEFSTRELTITLAGPIVRDRAAFFLDMGVQRFVGARGPSIGTDTTGGADSAGIGIRRASAERFHDILKNTYGVDPGTIEVDPFRNPAGNVFGKVTLWPGLNQRIEVSHSFAFGTPEIPGGYNGVRYNMSSKRSTNPGTVNATRLTWTMAGIRRFANEFLLSRLATTDHCRTHADYPDVRVAVDNGFLRAGMALRCSGIFIDNTTWELTDNLSWSAGTHHVTVGTHSELIRQDGETRLNQPLGTWDFRSLDALEAGRPFQYRRDVPNPAQPEGSGSKFRVWQLGLYAQDKWMPKSNLTLTAGLRFDVPFLPDPPPPDPLLRDSLQIDTSLAPTGNLLWSPRFGFNYDAGGKGKISLRGGAGLFSGRPIYLYFTNVYETAGLEPLFLSCTGANVPAFTLDLANQPTSCGSAARAVSVFTAVNPSFRFPRNLRVSLGTDVSLPGGMVGTVDLLYIRGVDQLDVIDANLTGTTGTATGEGGRMMYGAIDADGTATPNRRNANIGRVVEMRSSSGDRAISATAQLQKRVHAGTMSIAYTHTDARDRMSAVCFNLSCNLDWVPVDGTLENRRLGTSRFEAAHKVTFGGVMQLPGSVQLGVFYNGFSGIPYTYLVEGDPNADGLSLFGGNDAVYVPRNVADITLADPDQWAALDSTINAELCLRSQRGQVMRRNSCRDHWLTLLNARISKRVGLLRGQSFEVIADVFNVLNLINEDWGVQRRVGGFGGDTRLLSLVGYDLAKGRGIYDVLRVDPDARDNEATRWRLQLGTRYSF